jgi:hypothetical protein
MSTGKLRFVTICTYRHCEETFFCMQVLECYKKSQVTLTKHAKNYKIYEFLLLDKIESKEMPFYQYNLSDRTVT